MPSPFPGMDPYLENPAWWTGLHHRFINVSSDLLQPILLDRGYYVDIEERVWLVAPNREVLPDLVVDRHSQPQSQAATLEVDEPIRIERVPTEFRESYIEIRDRAGDRLITTIELLSPTNKSQTEGRRLYARKQREMRASGVNLVEIDLLRSGAHLVDLPLDLLSGGYVWDYVVNIVRPGAGDYEFYPIRLRDRLPRIRIPLKQEDEDVGLDLQVVLDQVYDHGPYSVRINNQDPPIPLAPADAAWAKELLMQL